MKAFDTDLLTEILAGNAAYAQRLANVPVAEQAVPIVVIEEIIRGRLNTIRQAEAGKTRVPIEQAYLLFEQTLGDLREVKILSFTHDADVLLKEWRKKKIKGSTHDLRIAASCVVSSATLITTYSGARPGTAFPCFPGPWPYNAIAGAANAMPLGYAECSSASRKTR